MPKKIQMRPPLESITGKTVKHRQKPVLETDFKPRPDHNSPNEGYGDEPKEGGWPRK